MKHTYYNYNDSAILILQVCVKGNPYNNPIHDNMREVIRVIVHPKYNKEKHTSDIVLIRMDKIYRGKTHFISELSPLIFHDKDIKNNKVGVFLWSNGQDFLPHKLNKKDVTLLQWQTLYYSMNTSRCPVVSDIIK